MPDNEMTTDDEGPSDEGPSDAARKLWESLKERFADREEFEKLKAEVAELKKRLPGS